MLPDMVIASFYFRFIQKSSKKPFILVICRGFAAPIHEVDPKRRLKIDKIGFLKLLVMELSVHLRIPIFQLGFGAKVSANGTKFPPPPSV